VAGQPHRSARLLLIVALVSGCDNVEWGGAEVRLEPPPAPVSSAPDTLQSTSGDSAAVPLPELPSDPVLFMGSRRGSTVEMVPVAELTPSGPVALPSEEDAPGFNRHWMESRFPRGRELTLLAAGTRVGTLVVDTTGVAADWCETRPTLTGTPELVPGAAGTQRFLAVARPDDAGPELRHGRYRTARDTEELRSTGLRLAYTAIARSEAPWPPSVRGALRDMQTLYLHPDSAPALAATFAYQDQLAVGEAEGPNAYALFFVAEAEADGYGLSFVRYRRAEDGKAMPRYFQHADWDGDAAAEILVELFGSEARGVLLLDRGPDGWREAFELPCAPPAGN
jgi:hypothetical protein